MFTNYKACIDYLQCLNGVNIHKLINNVSNVGLGPRKLLSTQYGTIIQTEFIWSTYLSSRKWSHQTGNTYIQ